MADSRSIPSRSTRRCAVEARKARRGGARVGKKDPVDIARAPGGAADRPHARAERNGWRSARASARSAGPPAHEQSRTGPWPDSSSASAALAGVDGSLLVDLVRVLRELGHDDHLVRAHLDEAAGDEQDLLGAALLDAQLTDPQRTDQPRVMRQDSELTIDPRARSPRRPRRRRRAARATISS